MTGLALEVRNLDVVYETKGTQLPVLRDLNITIAAGETYGLVGESGCGKSTAAYAVARYLPKNGRVVGGSIRVDGEDVLSLGGEQLRRFRATRFAMVYQEPGAALNPTMRIGDQLAEVHVARGESVVEARSLAVEGLAEVALPDPPRFALRYPHELSGGQQQRVVIAMALAVQPRLLVLDEPTTGLDATVEAEVLDLVERLKEGLGLGVLLISHNLPLVARTCDRVGVLYAGRLVEEGAAQTMVTAPLHPYTGGLLRCVPRISTAKGSVRLEPIPGRVAPLGAVPPGCVFASRCVMATDECRGREPSMEATGGRDGDHRVRCFRPGSLEERPLVPAPAEVPRQVTGAPVIRVEHLTKRYGRVVACDDVNLEIGVGEVLGLVGESGSGKTTLGRCIAGLTSYEGTVRIDGAEQSPIVERRDREVRRRLQMVFQQPDATLNPRRTATAILRSAIRRLRGPWSVEELAERVQLDGSTLRVRSGRLSGGQKQRVAIARAFAGRPAVVVCDEPVSALDVSVQATVLELLGDLQRAEGVSYLFISHDLGVVRYLADRIGVMYRGHIMELGPANTVFATPHHPYTEMLLGAVPRLDDLQARRHRRTHAGPAIEASEQDGSRGCRFASRCPHRIDGLCDVLPPPWQSLEPGHDTRCHLPSSEIRALQGAVDHSRNIH